MGKNRSRQSKKKRSRAKGSRSKKYNKQEQYLKKNEEQKTPVEQTAVVDVHEDTPKEELAADNTEADVTDEEAIVDNTKVDEPEEETAIDETESDTPAEETVSTETESDAPVEVTEAGPLPAAKKSHKTGLKVIAIVLMLVAYSAAFVYGAFAVEKNIVSPDRYPDHTVINDVDVSGMTIKEAKKALTKAWNKRSITIVDTNDKIIGSVDKFDFKYKIYDQLEAILHPGAEKALSRFITRDHSESVIRMTPLKNTKLFQRQFEKLEMVKNSVGDKPSKNAYIDKSDTEFRIVKEVIGNSVDTKMLRKAIFEAIARGEDSFEYRRSSFYKAPEIISTSKVLLDEREYCKKYLSFKINLRNSVGDYTITPDWLDKMLHVDESGNTRISDDSISQFISDVLYPKFSSTGDTRRLTSAGGGKYTVSGGTFGFTIDVDKEHEVLTKELKEREDVEREPYYSGKKPNKNGTSDIGDDFVEVSIAKQNVWVVKNGKVVVDTPVVTGNVPRHNTPTGVYYIVYKATNTTLKGHNDDGSEYESHVAYWMPFYLGFGLHDASWRGVFGGSIYMGNGSHGCVNCPPPVMPKIFSECYEGMPVIVH